MSEQEKTKKLSKSEQHIQNTAITSAVISSTFFPFIVANRKNSFLAYDFIAEMTEMFMLHCKKNKYTLGENRVNDRESLIDWCRDALMEHPDFKDVKPEG